MIKRIKNIFKKSIPFGQTLPSWKSDQPVWTDWSTEKAIKHGYKASTYVYACVNLIAKSAASVPWKVYKKDRKGDWIEQPDHPLQALIDRPNDFMSKKDFIERMTQNLYLGGNAIFSKVRANGTVVELWSLPTDAVKPVPDRNTFIKHYEYRKDGVTYQIPNEDIIHNMFLDPASLYWGISPLQAGAKIIDTDVEAVRFNKVALQNRAVTDGVFTFKQPLTRDQWEQARDMIREQHQGSGSARQPWVIGSDADWKQMSLTPAELDFIESRRFTRSEICALFQVPPPMISIYDQATLANIETARKIFWLDTIIPYLTDIQSCLNQSLTPDFGTDIELGFDVSNVDAIQTNFNDKIANAKALWSMGIPFNQINQKLELGFDPVVGGDQGFIPSGVIPASQDFFADPEDNQDGQGKSFLLPTEQKTGFISGFKLLNEEHKTFYWKNLERRRGKWYTALTRKSADLFKKEGQKVAEVFKDRGLTAALETIDEQAAAWETWLINTWKGMTEEFGRDHYEDLITASGIKKKSYQTKEESPEDDYFNPWDEIISGYITETVGDKIQLIQQFSKEQVKETVFRIRQEEEGTIDQVASGIIAQYDDFARYRTYRIARTEVVSASNFANMQAGRQVTENHGISLIKAWITSRDSRVRDSHRAMDGQTRGQDEPFGNGLMFPAEYRGGRASEVIQCRCAIAWEVDEMGLES